jgi:SAM domain (Sterile alpha motif)
LKFSKDLTAIGIQKPNHRKKLKAEIAQLHIPDGLPEFIPVRPDFLVKIEVERLEIILEMLQDTLEEWLSLLGLAEYSPSLRRQGYRTVEDVTQLTWEDLEDFGILRLGHQKKITLAIKRVKDILSGKFVASPTESAHGSCCYVTQEVVIGQSVGHVTSPKDSADLSTFHQYRSSHYAIPPAIMRPVYMAPQQQQVQHPHPCYPPHPQHQQHPQYAPQPPPQPIQQPIYYQYQQPTYQPDVVAIQVRNPSGIPHSGIHGI